MNGQASDETLPDSRSYVGRANGVYVNEANADIARTK